MYLGLKDRMHELRRATSQEWLEKVLGNFDAFLVDHANCERKASATALSLVSHYPDRKQLVDTMIPLACEELEHFQLVYQHMAQGGLILGPDTPDDYVQKLQKLIRRGSDLYFMDRLLVAGVVERRGSERFFLLAESLPLGAFKELYQKLSRAEARHQALFFQLAEIYFEKEQVRSRLNELLDIEAKIIEHLPLRAAVH